MAFLYRCNSIRPLLQTMLEKDVVVAVVEVGLVISRVDDLITANRSKVITTKTIQLRTVDSSGIIITL